MSIRVVEGVEAADADAGQCEGRSRRQIEVGIRVIPREAAVAGPMAMQIKSVFDVSQGV